MNNLSGKHHKNTRESTIYSAGTIPHGAFLPIEKEPSIESAIFAAVLTTAKAGIQPKNRINGSRSWQKKRTSPELISEFLSSVSTFGFANQSSGNKKPRPGAFFSSFVFVPSYSRKNTMKDREFFRHWGKPCLGETLGARRRCGPRRVGPGPTHMKPRRCSRWTVPTHTRAVSEFPRQEPCDPPLRRALMRRARALMTARKERERGREAGVLHSRSCVRNLAFILAPVYSTTEASNKRNASRSPT